MSKKKPKDNIIMFSPGGYGPYSRLYFWSGYMEYETSNDEDEESDNWTDAMHEFVAEQDVDYGCYAMTIQEAEEIYKKLGKLLGK
jgi:hypothetical protein